MYTIDSIIATLNQIEVRGKNNLDLLLGAIIALESLKIDTERAEALEKEEEELEDG